MIGGNELGKVMAPSASLTTNPFTYRLPRAHSGWFSRAESALCGVEESHKSDPRYCLEVTETCLALPATGARLRI